MFARRKKNIAANTADHILGQTSTPITRGGFDENDIGIFLNISNDILVIINDLGEIVKCNDSFLSLTGHMPEKLQGLHFLDLFNEQDKPYNPQHHSSL